MNIFAAHRVAERSSYRELMYQGRTSANVEIAETIIHVMT